MQQEKTKEMERLVKKHYLDDDFINLDAREALKEYGEWVRQQTLEEAIGKIRQSKIWKLVPNTPRMIMCSDKELDNLLQALKNKNK